MLLRQMLYRCEPAFLNIIASYWLKLRSTPNYEELIRMLCARMGDPAVLRQKLNSPEGAELQPPLQFLIQNNGIVEAETFEEAFGPFRVAGTDKIIRGKMWQNPVSLTEKLRYRGLIFREIRPVGNELKDCYILPEDQLKLLSGIIPADKQTSAPAPTLTVRPAIPSETAFVSPPDNSLPDLFCLTLALRRDGRPLAYPGLDAPDAYSRFLEMLCTEGPFFGDQGDPDSEAIRSFLVQNRTAAKIQMIRIWLEAPGYDELSESPEISVLEAPVYSKPEPRKVILSLLKTLQPEGWFSVNGLLAAVKKADPQFLRRSFGENRGQLRDRDGNDLSGIGSWFQLEGAWLRFLLSGPLNWLGLIQCAYTDRERRELSAFRVTQDMNFYLSEAAQPETAESILSKPNLEQALPTISGDGELACSGKVPRYFRYMAARYAEPEKVNGDRVILRITPASLSRAEAAGLTRTSLLTLLRRFSKNKVPPSLERMLSAEGNASHTALIYSATILTVPDEEILAELLNTTRLEKWIFQQINPSSVLIDPKGITEIRRFLMEREMFVDVEHREQVKSKREEGKGKKYR